MARLFQRRTCYLFQSASFLTYWHQIYSCSRFDFRRHARPKFHYAICVFSQIYKALNTVLGFCSTRKHLATTFPVIRSSVESLIRRFVHILNHISSISPGTSPLELNKVAEIKSVSNSRPLVLAQCSWRHRALLPDLIKFAYIPQSDHRINADSQPHKGKERAQAPDYSAFTTTSSSQGTSEEAEHVLILDFAELGKPRSRKEDLFVLPSCLQYSSFMI